MAAGDLTALDPPDPNWWSSSFPSPRPHPPILAFSPRAYVDPGSATATKHVINDDYKPNSIGDWAVNKYRCNDPETNKGSHTKCRPSIHCSKAKHTPVYGHFGTGAEVSRTFRHRSQR